MTRTRLHRKHSPRNRVQVINGATHPTKMYFEPPLMSPLTTITEEEDESAFEELSGFEGLSGRFPRWVRRFGVLSPSRGMVADFLFGLFDSMAVMMERRIVDESSFCQGETETSTLIRWRRERSHPRLSPPVVSRPSSFVRFLLRLRMYTCHLFISRMYNIPIRSNISRPPSRYPYALTMPMTKENYHANNETKEARSYAGSVDEYDTVY